MKQIPRRFVLIAGLLAAQPALAEDKEPFGGYPESPDSAFKGDYVILGVGAMSLPNYEGADSSHIIPVVGAMGELGGIGFSIKGPSLALDLIRDKPGAKSGLRFGPQIRYRSNRHRSIGDPVVESLGKLGTTVEAGGRIGGSFEEVLSKHDKLSVGISVRWDISGKGAGRVITPNATYMLPVSRGQVVGLLASAQIMSDKYADYNFAVTPAGSAASGLPVYDARSGLKDMTVGLGTAFDFNGNFLDGGFAVGGGAMYTRLFNSAAESPVTSIRGSRNQWFFAAGLGYTF